MSKKLQRIAKSFGALHAKKKHIDTELDRLKREFAESITFTDEELGRQTLWYAGSDPEAFIQTQYPKWSLVKKDRMDNGEWRLLIQENPLLKSFLFVNPDDKKVYQRTVAEGVPQPDLEKLREQDVELYLRVTYQPTVPRDLRAASDISEEDWAKLSEFFLPPKLTPRMEAPRDAKPEELEGLDEE